MCIRDRPYGGGVGSPEHHSESPEGFYASVPGLKVVTCATPDDAYWMLRQSIDCDDPVVFFEPKRRYYVKGEISSAASTGLHQARVVRPGTDATLLCYGPMVDTCLAAAEAGEQEGMSLEVVDLRSVSPIDMATVEESVRSTTRAIVVQEAARTQGIGAELSARLTESLYYVMEAPVLRVTSPTTPYPPSRVESSHLPDVDRILDAVDRSLAY